jgi:replicative DNA helicase
MKRINSVLGILLRELAPQEDTPSNEHEQDFIERPRLNIGFKYLNETLNGLKCGDLIVIGARPAMGKTSFALNLITQISKEADKPCIYFSNEMDSFDISMMLLSQHSRVGAKELRKKEFEPDALRKVARAIQELSSLNLYIDDSSGFKLENIIRECRQKKTDQEISLVIIDNLQLVRTTLNQDYADGTNKIMSHLKALALELNCPIIILSQIDRAIENLRNKRPRLSSLLGFGTIESIADKVLFIYRDEIYYQNSKQPGIAEIIIAKNRGGDTGHANLKWIGEYRTFEDLGN